MGLFKYFIRYQFVNDEPDSVRKVEVRLIGRYRDGLVLVEFKPGLINSWEPIKCDVRVDQIIAERIPTLEF